jgi:hypothetical protein
MNSQKDTNMNSQKDTNMNSQKDTNMNSNWNWLAQQLASNASENMFSQHWGSGSLRDEDGYPIGFYFFDNHPYSDEGQSTQGGPAVYRASGGDNVRTALYQEVIRAVEDHDPCAALLAEAIWPPKGCDDAGYTRAFLFRCEEDTHEFAVQRLREEREKIVASRIARSSAA